MSVASELRRRVSAEQSLPRYEPCLPRPAKRPPAGPGWIHEIKHDGFRIIAHRTGDRVQLVTRGGGNNFASRFPLIAAAIAALPVRSCVVDGEAIACDENGLAVFDLIRYQCRSVSRHRPISLCAFDLLELDGRDLQRDPIEKRKALLAELLEGSHSSVVLNEHFEEDGACQLGCEGIVSKRLGTPKAHWRAFISATSQMVLTTADPNYLQLLTARQAETARSATEDGAIPYVSDFFDFSVYSRTDFMNPLIEIGDNTGLQVVDRRSDVHLRCTDKISDERTRREKSAGGPFGACHCGVVGEIAGVTPHREGRRQNRLDHRPDRAGIVCILGDDVARGLHRAAGGMGHDDNERRAENGGAVFDRAEGRGVNEIASVARHKEFADAVTAKNELGRYSAVSTADDRRPGRLVAGHCAAACGKVDRAKFRMTHVALVARFKRGERIIRRERSRCAFRGARRQ
jgi:hypothetical protein